MGFRVPSGCPHNQDFFVLLWGLGLGTWQTDNETTDQIELYSVQKSVLESLGFWVWGLGTGSPRLLDPFFWRGCVFGRPRVAPWLAGNEGMQKNVANYYVGLAVGDEGTEPMRNLVYKATPFRV